MSAAIRTGAYDQTSAQAEAAAFARPQVQSRRVSLRLGPLGLTYATDELLWPPSPPSPPSGFIDDRQAPSATSSAAASEGSYTAVSPDFARELLAAARLADGARQEAEAREQAYGPGAAGRRNSAQSGDARQTATAAAPASAMRRAIAAYLSCASCAAPASMLSAVA